MKRLCIAGWMVLLAASAAVAQEEPKEPKPALNVDCFMGWQGYYRPLEWTSIDLQITSTFKEPFNAEFEVTAQQDAMTTMIVTQRHAITPKTLLHVPLAMKLNYSISGVKVRITDTDKGKTVFSQDFDVWSSGVRGLKAVREQDVLIGFAGQQKGGVESLRNVVTTTYHRTSEIGGQPAGGIVKVFGPNRGEVLISDKLARLLPWEWTGYAGLDLMVLYDLDLESLQADQAKAIADYVQNGGRLLIVMTARPLPDKNPVVNLLPLKLGQIKKVSIPDMKFMEHGGGKLQLGALSGKELSVWPIEQLNDKAWKKVRLAEATYAYGPVGFGKVGIVLFDPAELKLGNSQQATELWSQLVDPLLCNKTFILDGSVSGNSGGSSSSNYELGAWAQPTNTVLEHLLNISQLKPLSIWWMVGLLAGLALILGPIDYLVLRAVDRLPWTWITSTVVILLFTAGAYYGVHAIRAGQTQVRAVTVVDSIQDGPAWRTSYMGIFAAESDRYQLQDAPGDSWWAAITPTQGNSLNMMHNETAGRQVFCAQDKGNLPSGLPISIWSMQCLSAEMPTAAPGLVVQDIVLTGQKISFTAFNNTDQTLRAAGIRINGRWFAFGPMLPGSKKDFSGQTVAANRQHEQLAAALTSEESEQGYSTAPAGAAFDSQACARRTAAIEEMANAGQAVVYGLYIGSPACASVKGQTTLNSHVEFVRLVVKPYRVE